VANPGGAYEIRPIALFVPHDLAGHPQAAAATP
jgi:hypothetical protein